MTARTISICQGKGSLGHNNRAFHTKNTDPNRTPNNIVFVREPIGLAYDKLFSAAVERYNAHQKRSDRKVKTGYFEQQFGQPVTETKLTSPDKRKSFYECLVQLGTMEDTGVGTADGERATECLCEYMKGFSQRNPNFYVFNAVIHLDEKTPHLHIDYIPVGHYKRGIDTQNGIAQALKEMGYGDGKNAIARWRQSEYLVFRKICEEHGFTISEPQKSRGSLTVSEYKKFCADKKRLNEKLQPLREMELAADESVIVGKKQLLSSNISVSPEELALLETQKKAAAVQSLDNQQERDSIERRRHSLDEREADIAAKETESLERQERRKKDLDMREKAIFDKEIKLSELVSEVNQKREYAETMLERAKSNLKFAQEEQELQRDLNEKYSALNVENTKNINLLLRIRRALHIPDNDTETDIVGKCETLVKDNAAVKNELGKELGLDSDSCKKLSAAEMVRTLTANFKRQLSVLSGIKQEFIKVVLALNMLVYTQKYSQGLTGMSKALASGISLFADNCFKRRGEYESIDKSVLDSEIKENMELFIKPEHTNERTNYYTR